LRYLTNIEKSEKDSEMLQASQLRYLGYFGEVLKGFIPLNKPLILQRVIMNGLPDVEDENSFGNEDGYDDNDDEKLSPGDGGYKVKKGEQRRIICTPYI
jgi:hypothetical protein